ncbi:helix-turn-helix domain-containing protein [Streptomyces sp. NBC_01283]|uniref:hypothetical protein n=1 Tax=Streptomyces sp. NBC_01283 TaxID=2903812 RepID=UPI00352E6190|nr:helix-turn-helix domain-containing protein [Streptomyces sp. NBC_01283]
MAADRFTQIVNALFRDRRISFKAKGLFGLVSTHRDGWRVTVTELARWGPDDRSAVRSGLQELEAYGYLTREQQRREDGTLGEVLYALTDAPTHLYELLGDGAPAPALIVQSRRSQPESDFPTSGKPTSVIAHQRRPVLRRPETRRPTPSVRIARARVLGAPPWEPGEQTRSAMLSAGERLLRAIGARQPELLLTGQALADQGRIVQGLLDEGWTPKQLRYVIADRPLPMTLHHTVGTVVARLRAAQTTPPDAATPADAPPPSTGAADRTVAETVARRVLVEWAGCGSPPRAQGQDLCPACLNWPLCTGPTPRRAEPAGDGRCTVCAAPAAARTSGSCPASASPPTGSTNP